MSEQKQDSKQGQKTEGIEADKQNLPEAKAKVEVKAVSLEEALKTADGEERKGKLVKHDSLVKTAGDYFLIDSYTKKRYDSKSWVEAEPSPWLDGQLRAGKIIIK